MPSDHGPSVSTVAVPPEITAKNERQETPWHLAASNGHADIAKMLRDAAKEQPGHAERVEKRRVNDEPQIGG